MTTQRFNTVLGVVFLIVGILAAYSTWRLHTYIAQTLPRDAAQEQCTAKTIAVLTDWGQNRIARDKVLDVRDDAARTVLDRLIAGQDASVAEITAWRDAVNAERQSRRATVFAPLPAC